MRTLVDEMSNIGLNYGTALSNDVENNIVIVLLKRYLDINGFVAELVDHCVHNHDRICPVEVDDRLQVEYKKNYDEEVKHAIMVWGVVCSIVSKESHGIFPKWKDIAAQIRAISNNSSPLQIDKEDSFSVVMRGWDPNFSEFSILTAKQTRWTSVHHSTRIST